MMKENLWLVTLPHAGGGSSIFKGWDKNINCQVLNVEYPGHWTRLKEPLVDTFKDLENDVLNHIVNSIGADSHIIIFGHSLGAIIAWEIVGKLYSRNIFVEKLFLSASQNPGAFPEEKIINLHTDDEMFSLIGWHRNINNNTGIEQLKKIFLPIIKSDLKICQEYEAGGLYCDIAAVVFYGLDDSFTYIDEVQKWNRYVKCESVIGLPGDHFYLGEKENRKIIFGIINDYIKDLNVLPYSSALQKEGRKEIL